MLLGKSGGFVRLSKLAITNHTRVQDVQLEVRQHLVLVGPNDVGKSSILRCLNMILGASTAQVYGALTPDDVRDQSVPLVLEVDLQDFSEHDEGLFPDEINVIGDVKSITLRLEALFDAHGTLSVDRRAVGSGHMRQLSRPRDAIGWTLLSATAMSRDLREGRRSAVDDILEKVELGGEQADFDAIAAQAKSNCSVHLSSVSLRSGLADQALSGSAGNGRPG
ncbi:hypothetical protein GCM10025868_11230 [Angustibacter aerolatus]|uniref:AAA domain-containing protein n=1 Tax=Angustibacter aerolatus TaxID=1162965 RepID=A0ABQ6JCI4_9ACTN|nr:hypothetical protein [Angustibacter aerolatus]GMA85873.1 hypothetical protein GCM10025868_11230 [Angustibacter aerolatus]